MCVCVCVYSGVPSLRFACMGRFQFSVECSETQSDLKFRNLINRWHTLAPVTVFIISPTLSWEVVNLMCYSAKSSSLPPTRITHSQFILNVCNSSG